MLKSNGDIAAPAAHLAAHSVKQKSNCATNKSDVSLCELLPRLKQCWRAPSWKGQGKAKHEEKPAGFHLKWDSSIKTYNMKKMRYCPQQPFRSPFHFITHIKK